MPSYGSLLTEVVHPFGRGGSINTTGAIYGASVSTEGSTSEIAVESVTVPLPTHALIKEIEFGLTVGLRLTVTTDSPKLSYYIADSGNTTDSLVAFTSTTLAALVSTTTLVDFTCAGRKTPSDGTYFTGVGSFVVTAQVAANASTSKVQGAMKQSSYVIYSYYLTA